MTHRPTLVLSLAAATVAAALLPRARAATVSWTGATSASWGDATNWSSNPTLPGPADDVLIPDITTGSHDVEYFDTTPAATVNSLTLDGIVNLKLFPSLANQPTITNGLTLKRGALYIGGAWDAAHFPAVTQPGQTGGISFSGSLDNTGSTFSPTAPKFFFTNGATVSGGSLSLAAPLLIDGVSGTTITFDHVTFASDLTIQPPLRTASMYPVRLINAPALDHTLALGIFDSSTRGTPNLEFVGDQTLTGTGSIVFNNAAFPPRVSAAAGGSLTIGPSITITTLDGRSNSRGLVGRSDAALTNYGTLRADGANESISASGTTVVNHGTIQITNGASSTVSSLNNASDGLVTATSASALTLQGVNGGPWSNAGTISATNTPVILSGQWNNTSNISSTGSALAIQAVNAGTWTNTGILTASSAAVTISASPSLASAAGTLAFPNSTVAVTKNFPGPVLSSAFANSPGASFTFTTLIIDNANNTLALHPTATATFRDAEIQGGTLTSTLPISEQFVTGAYRTRLYNLTLNAPWESNFWTWINGGSINNTLTVKPGAKLTVTNSTFINGTVDVQPGGTFEAEGGFTNLGTVRLRSATTNVTYAFAHLSKFLNFDADDASTFRLNPGVTLDLDNLVNPPFPGGTVDFNSATLANGTLPAPFALTHGPVTFNNVTLTGSYTTPASFTNTGSITLAGALKITGSLSNPGTITLTPTGALLLDYTGPSPIDSLRTDLLTHHLTSPSTPTAVAYAEAAQLNLTTYAGLDVDPTTLLAILTLPGDANLDGLLNHDDYALLDRSLAHNTANPHWTDGDFNYDGLVNSADHLILDTAYLSTHPASPQLLAQRESQLGPAYVQTLLASVPEPSSLLLLATGYCLLTTPRPRRRPH